MLVVVEICWLPLYDPNVSDAFDMDNMVEGTNNKLVSSAEKTAWNNKLDNITGESIADLSDVGLHSRNNRRKSFEMGYK